MKWTKLCFLEIKLKIEFHLKNKKINLIFFRLENDKITITKEKLKFAKKKQWEFKYLRKQLFHADSSSSCASQNKMFQIESLTCKSRDSRFYLLALSFSLSYFASQTVSPHPKKDLLCLNLCIDCEKFFVTEILRYFVSNLKWHYSNWESIWLKFIDLFLLLLSTVNKQNIICFFFQEIFVTEIL